MTRHRRGLAALLEQLKRNTAHADRRSHGSKLIRAIAKGPHNDYWTKAVRLEWAVKHKLCDLNEIRDPEYLKNNVVMQHWGLQQAFGEETTAECIAPIRSFSEGVAMATRPESKDYSEKNLTAAEIAEIVATCQQRRQQMAKEGI